MESSFYFIALKDFCYKHSNYYKASLRRTLQRQQFYGATFNR
jgi:hypothetical protein